MGNFSKNIVNQRFVKVYSELEQLNLIKGKSDIAKKLGTYNHVINSILKGQRNITVDQLNKLFDVFGVNANFLFGLSEELFINPPEHLDLPVRSLHDRRMGGRQNITLVPDKAIAGYALQHQNEAFLNDFQKFSIPGLDGNYIAFEISGDSMLPTITSGDIVICEALERDAPLRDNHVYVIVTDVVVAKRIQQIRNGNSPAQLRLISDNDAVYKPYNVELEDIQQALKVKCRMTNHAIE